MPLDLYPCVKCREPLFVPQEAAPVEAAPKREAHRLFARCTKCRSFLEFLPDFSTIVDRRIADVPEVTTQGTSYR